MTGLQEHIMQIIRELNEDNQYIMLSRADELRREQEHTIERQQEIRQGKNIFRIIK